MLPLSNHVFVKHDSVKPFFVSQYVVTQAYIKQDFVKQDCLHNYFTKDDFDKRLVSMNIL